MAPRTPTFDLEFERGSVLLAAAVCVMGVVDHARGDAIRDVRRPWREITAVVCPQLNDINLGQHM